MANLQKIVYLTEPQLQTLFSSGSITVNGTTVIYSDDDLYVTPTAGAAEITVVTPSTGTSFTLSPCPVTYNFGEKETLSVAVSATSQYHFMFSCPSGSPTTLTITGITGVTGDTTLEAGKTYEVDIWAGIAMYRKIEVTAV